MGTDWTPYQQHKNTVRNIMVQSLVDALTGGEAALAKALQRRKLAAGALKAFDFLGFKPKSMSPNALTSMYKAAAKTYHPDIAGPEAKGTMQVVNKAWKTLLENVPGLE